MTTASALSGEAFYALGMGDTVLAAEKYAAAGKLLKAEAAAARKRSDRDYILFLAASSCYHGGHYKEALKLARRIEDKFLAPHHAKLFAQFVKDATTRSAPGYAAGIRAEVRRLRGMGEWAAALELLKSHHYVMTRDQLVFCRGDLCDHLGEFEVAALFYKKSLEFRPDDPRTMLRSGAYASSLMLDGPMDRAEGYVAAQLAELGNAVSYMNAAWLTHHRLLQMNDSKERRGLLTVVLNHFRTGCGLFERLPETFRNDRLILELAELALSATVVAAFELQGPQAANGLLDAALKAVPISMPLRELRQLIGVEGDSEPVILKLSNYVHEQIRRNAERSESRSRQNNLAA